MPKSYKITYYSEFNKQDIGLAPFSFERQYSLKGVSPPPQTIIYKARDQIRYKDFQKYIIEHEMEENAFGRIGESAFQKYIRKEFIQSYDSPSEQILILSGKKRFVLDFCRKTKHINEIKLNTIQIDMGTLQTKLPHVKGVWFRFQNGLVRASALMGSNLESTSDYQKFMSQGDISTLSFFYEFESITHPIMATNDGTIVLYNNYLEISDEISIVMDIHKNLLLDIMTKIIT